MTTGSWNRTQMFLDSYGFSTGTTYWVRSWSGTDSPKLAKYPPAPIYEYVRIKHTRRGDVRVVKRIPLPGWKRFVDGGRPLKRELKVDHPYTMSEQYRSDESLTFQNDVVWVYPPGYHAPAYGHGAVMNYANIGSWAANVILDANDQLRLVGKLGEKIRGSGFNLGVALAEAPEAIQMIGDSAIRIAKSLTHLKRGDLAGAARSLMHGTDRKPIKAYKSFSPLLKGAKNDLSSNWLQLQYGWLPLLQDIEAGAQVLAHFLNVPYQESYRVKVSREINSTAVARNSYYSSAAKVVQRHQRVIIARLAEKPSIPLLLGLTDPLSIAWEKLPFSFVADWFLPVGDWLEARALSQGLVGTYVTSDKRTGIVHPPKITGNASPKNPRCTYRQVVFGRTISNVLDVPMPVVKQLSKVASWRHLANASALLLQHKS